MAISSPGIGSGLDINGIISRLMEVEAQPLSNLARKEAGFQAKLGAYASVSTGLGTFKGAIAGLTAPTKFQQLSTSVGDSSVLTASASSKAVAGSYSVNIAQLAQAQTIKTEGVLASTTTIGSGVSSTLTFQFGTISGGSYVKSGVALAGSVASGGIAAGSLILNGTNITTNSGTTSAKALATAINLKTDTTGVTAVAAPTTTAVLGAFTDVATGVGDTYTMSVGGVNIASLGDSSSLAVADLDLALNDATPGAVGNLLTAAGITVNGSAAAGTLSFTRADGANIDITQTLGGAASGGFAGFVSGTAQVTTSSVSLASDTDITVGGNAPGLAGLTAGSGLYTDAGFDQDPNQSSGQVTIDSTNNSLQGIRDAINKAKIGVTASIISDGSAAPYRLVFTSNKTGAVSSMKVTVTGDTDLQNLLAYDATSVAGQKMSQSSAGQDTMLSVNGIAITSSTNVVSEAIQGVTLTAAKVGSSSISVSRDTSAVSTSVNAFVKGFNELNTSLRGLTSYNAETREGGVLLGDATVRTIQTGIRRMLTTPIPELEGNSLKNLTDIGITFQKDGSLSVNTSKLQAAISSNVDEIAGLFASFGTSTDSLVSVVSSTSATKSGSYGISIATPAAKGQVTGNLTFPGSTLILANSSLTVTLDGTSANVPLVAGSFTGQQLATMLQSAINGVANFSALGSAVTATINGDGFLNVTSNRFGSSSKVALASGNNVTSAEFLGASPTTADGADVAGTIGGYSATGSGQNLTGAPGTLVEGLKILIEENAVGGTVNFSQGYAYQLNNLLSGYVESTGLVSSRTKGLNTSIADLARTREQINAKLVATEKRYRAQFVALDTAMSKMTTTSTYLTQQLASLASLSNGS